MTDRYYWREGNGDEQPDDRYTNSPGPTDRSDDRAACPIGCGHRAHVGLCTGTGADLDPEYGIPADQPCACTGEEPTQ